MSHPPTVETSRRTSSSRWQGEYNPYSHSVEDATSPMAPEKLEPTALSPLRRKTSLHTSTFDRSNGLQGVFFERSLLGVLFILVPFLVALLAAIGHHLVNAHLNGRDVGEETNLIVGGTTLSTNWVVSVGTAFAFLFKAALAASIAGAFWQRVWRVARKHDISVESYDAIFGILHSPLPFFRAALWKAAFGLAMIAVLLWLIPIATVFTPGSIKTTIRDSLIENSCKLPATGSFCFGTTYTPDTRDVAFHQVNGDYVSPSIAANNLFHRTFVGGAEVPWLSPCPGAQECRYSVIFDGLGVDCDSNALDPQDLIQRNPNTWYFSRTRGVVRSPSDPDVQRGLVGGAIIDVSAPANSSFKGQWTQRILELAWLHAPVGDEKSASYRSLRCIPTNTTYTVGVVEKFGVQTASLQSQKLNAPIIGAGFFMTQPNQTTMLSADRLSDPLAAMFDSLSTEITWSFATQGSGDDSIGSKSGSIRRIPTLGHVLSLQASTNLVYSSQFVTINPGSNNITFGDFGRLIPELAYNMSLSVFSSGFNTTTGECSIYQTRQVYTYAPRTLWLPYGLALFMALPVLALGFLALYDNKRAAPGINTFSLLLEAMRGRTLHELFVDRGDTTAMDAERSEGGEHEIRRRVQSTVLRYGQHSHNDRGVFEVAEMGRSHHEHSAHGLLPELLT